MASKICNVAGAHPDAIWSVDWWRCMPDDRLVTGSIDETVKEWALKDDALEKGSSFDDNYMGVVSNVCHPKSPLVLASGMDSRIRIYDLGNTELKATIDAGPVECWTLSCSPDGANIASGTHTGAVNIWDIESQKLVSTLDTNGAFTLAVAYSPDGKTIASSSKDGAVYLFDVSTGKIKASLTDHTLPVRSLSFSLDGGLLFSASDDLTVGIYDAIKGVKVGSLRGHLNWVLTLAVSADGRHLATGSADNTVKLWDHVDRKCVNTFEKAHTDQVHGVSFNYNGSRLASVGGEGNLQVYAVPPFSAGARN
eukprot:CAMPEP_0203746990 /NCGR_PEP_ID=MMETSP0098-20131031/2247_1 /ASSEMBLY_ACC=CAM_ASM_000208 /TAXON_ID=96639 /ORGANISM=" , Strain NY0313808BC1" /LENGTH=308 /DNA_ID=CAMNT_0050635253 /DNA_START=247 /DNA_END=1171 /DNA_ORIENTATION=+